MGWVSRCHVATPSNTKKTAIIRSVGGTCRRTSSEELHIDPDLQAVIDAWPALPEDIRTKTVQWWKRLAVNRAISRV